MFERPRSGERAVLVRLGLGAPLDPEDLSEFTQLATSAGAMPVATHHGPPRTAGSALSSSAAARPRKSASKPKRSDADVILVDHPLSPSQERNLEKLTGRRVLDRSGLILDIFAQRAKSHEGKLEVELAQLKHIASRLVRGWTHLERQRGGGIGLRGPGETQLETDRRLLGKRVSVLTQRLEKLKQQRETGRGARVAIPIPSVALVGYTNAGKSTLFRSLTGENAYVADQLFATLDPTVRRLRLPGGTPGGGGRYGGVHPRPAARTGGGLPVHAHRGARGQPAAACDRCQRSAPRRTHRGRSTVCWQQIGAGDIPSIRVFNKIDRLEDRSRGWIATKTGAVEAVWISAAKGAGLELLGRAVAERLSHGVQRMRLTCR